MLYIEIVCIFCLLSKKIILIVILSSYNIKLMWSKVLINNCRVEYSCFETIDFRLFSILCIRICQC